MEIGKKLKNARVQSGMTQENVAEKINVSRQTISNWENEKSYPDIISVIELSNLYSISLDVLLKGDEKMIEHLEESTNVVKSNQKMIWAIIVNIIVVALLITLNMFIPDNRYFLVGIFCLMVITITLPDNQKILRRIFCYGFEHSFSGNLWSSCTCRSVLCCVSDLSYDCYRRNSQRIKAP